MSLYRFFFAKVLKRKSFLRFFFTEDRIREFWDSDLFHSQWTTPKNTKRMSRIWFHAASAGELEILWPLILGAGSQGSELVVTAFSDSARGALNRLERTLIDQKILVLFVGFSPWEGEWIKAIRAVNPTLFITAKYEAWPELWFSLVQENIPLAIIAAKARKSLSIAQWFCKVFIGKIPTLRLFPVEKIDEPSLRQMFPDARIEVLGEPRWDRVFARAQASHPRVQALKVQFQNWARPWGVIGSAWPQDLEFFQSIWAEVRGTVWVVPHEIDAKIITLMQERLQKAGFTVFRTSQNWPTAPQERACILVDEMGFLLELYASADWAFVGGGFGVGTHSTIEPALYGIPVACGPRGARKFSEIPVLMATGQLSILQREADLQKWTRWVQLDFSERVAQKVKWTQDAHERLGATRKILAALEKMN